MAKKPKRAQLPLRMPESLRAQIEEAAQDHGVSMNAEMVARLQRSFDREQVSELEAKTDAFFTALKESGFDVTRSVEEKKK